ncbi:MAG TPA: DUF4416 family protein [Candidatus Binatia bacterium]|nr:DUF4416 family protein [Candidatus Binatia bacterium]
MGIARDPRPAKYFVGLLSSDIELFDAVEIDLTAIFGAIDCRSETWPWNVSRFYEKEMGTDLLRRFVSFSQLASPGNLAEIKLQTQRVEEKYRRPEQNSRRVNVDPGYLEAGKVVLASTKNAGHRIYLQSGIYAETTLIYYGGAYHASPHTYPDYLWDETRSFLTRLRSDYLGQLRGAG